MRHENVKEPRRAYEPPKVRELGTIETLTQGRRSGIFDGFFGGSGGFGLLPGTRSPGGSVS